MPTRKRRLRLPPVPAGAPRRPAKPAYREQYGVIVICPDERVQRAVFEGLRQLEACKLKVVAT
jgi:hypothetical protein